MTPLEHINTVYESSYLSEEIWTGSRRLAVANLENYDFQLSSSPVLVNDDFFAEMHYSCINDNILSIFRSLPVAQILTLAVLVRIPESITALISIGEAARIMLDETSLQMLSILMQVLERNAERIGGDTDFLEYTYSWRKEISYEEHLAKMREEEITHSRLLKQLDKSNTYSARELDSYYSNSTPSWVVRSMFPDNDDPHKRFTRALESNPFTDSERFSQRLQTEFDALGKMQKELSQQLIQIKHQEQQILGMQQELSQQLTPTKRQNEQILKMLQNNLQLGSSAIGAPTPKPREDLLYLSTEAGSHGIRSIYFAPQASHIGLRHKDGKHFLCVTTVQTESSWTAFQTLLAWLHLVLGGSDLLSIQSSLRCIRLRDENILISLGHNRSAATGESTNTQCWRKKITE